MKEVKFKTEEEKNKMNKQELKKYIKSRLLENKKYLIGYNLKKLFENEKGEEVYLNEFQEITILNSPFNKEKTLNMFISKNKEKLKENNINENKLLIEEYKDTEFNEMINIFKGGHH